MVKVVCLTARKTGSSSRTTSIRRPRSSACTTSSFTSTPSSREAHDRRRGGAVGQVGAGLSDQLAGPVERVERARIRPPALDDLAGQLATREAPVVHVGDLELPA